MQTGSEKLGEDPDKKVVYEIFKYNDDVNHWQLKISGKQADCPYQSATFPTSDGQFITVRQPCTTNCPLARIWKDQQDCLHYTISCGGIEKDEAVTEEQKSVIQAVPRILKVT